MTSPQPQRYRRVLKAEDLRVIKWTGDNAETLRAWAGTDLADVTFTELRNGALELFASGIYVTTVKADTYLVHEPGTGDWYGYNEDLLNEAYEPVTATDTTLADLPDRSVLMVTASTDTMFPVGSVLLLADGKLKSTHLSGDPLPITTLSNYDITCRIVERGGTT